MVKVGIIAEYNPFHNGHIYHLEKVKEKFPDSSIVLVLSSHFTQRGIPSILTKWEKTEIALQYGVDLVIELPYSFATQSADIFAKGAIEILKECGCNYLVFGSEENDIEKLKKLATIQLEESSYQKTVKSYLDQGINYPTALNLALQEQSLDEVKLPNDLLGLSYVKEIMKQNANIIPITIQRTTNYHDNSSTKKIASATSIRARLEEKKDIKTQVPKETALYLNKNVSYLKNYFQLFKYKVYSEPDLSIFMDVDEGIENRILKNIDNSIDFDDFIKKIKTKRYTYNKLMRMCNHILCGYTKKENEKYQNISYLRVLGFSKRGTEIIKEMKKQTKLPIITKFKKDISGLQLEKRITGIYASVLSDDEKQKIILDEYKHKIIKKRYM